MLLFAFVVMATSRLAQLASGMAAEGAASDFLLTSTLDSLFPEGGEAKENISNILTSLGYHLASETSGDLGKVAADVGELGVEAFMAGIPPTTPLPVRAEFSRFLALFAVPKPADGSSSNDTTLLMRAALKAVGAQDPVVEEQDRLRHKQTVGELSQALSLGVFSPLLLPDKDLLKSATIAEQLGHFLQPDEKQLQLDKKDHSFAKGLMHLLKTGVAGLLLHRITPAALLSEIAVVLDIAIQSKHPQAEAEQLALLYALKARQMVYDKSLNTPLKPDLDPSSFAEAMQIFLRKDLGLMGEAKECTGPAPPSMKLSGTDSAKNPDKNCCLRHGAGEKLCVQIAKKPCSFSHTCPFCAGKVCNNRPGYLNFHLASWKSPLEIRPKDHTSSSRRRSRSRSRRDRRGRDPAGAGRDGRGADAGSDQARDRRR